MKSKKEKKSKREVQKERKKDIMKEETKEIKAGDQSSKDLITSLHAL